MVSSIINQVAETVVSDEPLSLYQVRYSNSTRHIPSFVLDDKIDCGIRLGRSIENDFVLAVKDGPTIVSHHHAIIFREGDKVMLTDIGATNGTFVNGKRIEPHNPVHLKVNDKVDFAGREYVSEGRGYNPFQFIVKPSSFDDVKVPNNELDVTLDQYKKIEDEFKCGICLDTLLNPFCLACGHTTCGDCLADWFATLPVDGKSCPTCRLKVPSSSPFPCKNLNDVIERLVEPLLDKEQLTLRKYRKEIWENRKELVYKRTKKEVEKCALREEAAQEVDEIEEYDDAFDDEIEDDAFDDEIVEDDDDDPDYVLGQDEERNVRRRLNA